ncbi:MAG: biotin synthase BioB [gamma proteobacterium symbiont of Bathyaustriella thionipta]|nr:biotin synthase BioB [gamma proteobacterium symbiont of Bathyaustriella thionipta]MCU7950517.1 biotin synthase BioB [gamma proteobacterium symbiont of Bathyaustriella thionipta]MCU7952357.1 biotin synthase BioB [gamma proteobacterium symbiont of Bathyaustriella thionipta]MCU7957130.1 biotin synthase BioB [gamma proteobacterium symbiont of Bathyaustriella thionipta]MCU7967309.1 biotin synthase BioB [gamma proteobacterium symbiont of Bathyaustriella thionipta]
MTNQTRDEIRNDWDVSEVQALFDIPLNDLLFQSHTLHRANFDPNTIQISTLLSIKTGKCSEDCGYCSQSAHHNTALEAEALLPFDEVVDAAKKAKAEGADRFCMGAAWSRPNKRDFPKVLEMIKAVKSLDMESCVTLGMLDIEQVRQLKEVGLDYYNHNLDTSPEFYGNVISTRTFQDRLDTLNNVQEAGINVCSGGILGLGEARKDRCSLLVQLANMEKHPDSVPINMLVQVEGTPLFGQDEIEPLEFVRTVAVARIMMPRSVVRLSAGREEMSDEMQAMCFFAGANSVFYGERLLTTDGASAQGDKKLFASLGMKTSLEKKKSCANKDKHHPEQVQSQSEASASAL